tara:strand:+ start:379 stop:588 length:210 start_codon:yes stop_codon:yes gene_type:complete
MTKKEILEVTENIQKLRKPRTYRVGIALWNEHEIEAFSEDEALKIAEEIEDTGMGCICDRTCEIWGVSE